MRIAPIDIAHKSFGRKMMGLDPVEVMEFLKEISQEMESIIRERNQLKESIREKELAISEYRERDNLLKSTITTAQKMSEKIHLDAEREAKLILQDAEQKSDAIQREARDSLKRIYQEISELKKVRMQFEHNLRALVQSHLTMMEQAQKVMPNPSLSNTQLTIEPTMNLEMRDEDSKSIKQKVSQAVARAQFNP